MRGPTLYNGRFQANGLLYPEYRFLFLLINFFNPTFKKRGSEGKTAGICQVKNTCYKYNPEILPLHCGYCFLTTKSTALSNAPHWGLFLGGAISIDAE
jgi:hypothetical protein